MLVPSYKQHIRMGAMAKRGNGEKEGEGEKEERPFFVP
jgi:hypothetical protein